MRKENFNSSNFLLTQQHSITWSPIYPRAFGNKCSTLGFNVQGKMTIIWRNWPEISQAQSGLILKEVSGNWQSEEQKFAINPYAKSFRELPWWCVSKTFKASRHKVNHVWDAKRNRLFWQDVAVDRPDTVDSIDNWLKTEACNGMHARVSAEGWAFWIHGSVSNA